MTHECADGRANTANDYSVPPVRYGNDANSAHEQDAQHYQGDGPFYLLVWFHAYSLPGYFWSVKPGGSCLGSAGGASMTKANGVPL